MKILGLETSTAILSLAIIDEEELIVDYTRNLGLHHSKELMPSIAEIIEENGLTIKEIEGLSVSIGPGSFTGLRIGLATARGLAQSLNIPLAGIPTLDGIAFNLLFSNSVVCPILDARKGEVYAALYRMDGRGGMEKLTNYLVLPPERLITLIERPTLFLGNGLKVYGDLLKDALREQAHFPPDHFGIPGAANIAHLGLREIKEGRIKDLSSILPLYLRKSEAEIKWQKMYPNSLLDH
ncbi:TPA: tRNA (adenosine(37)-N6)-threonylcarbamoyltransferase complex dimerization subunit type 1 TsaB [bacterium]|nr:tRNA (adenosine(37)-N6)-threonylcarbamoyltransferase complex dimerization subunit type 1 TsaB [bacterium]